MSCIGGIELLFQYLFDAYFVEVTNNLLITFLFHTIYSAPVITMNLIESIAVFNLKVDLWINLVPILNNGKKFRGG